MSFFVVYDISTGRNVSSGTVIADPLDAGLAKKKFAAPPRDNEMWDEATLAFVSRPLSRVIPVQDFIDLFTDAEQESLLGHAYASGLSKKQHQIAETAIFRMKLQKTIDLDSVNVIKLAYALEQLGLLVIGRAKEILSG